MTTWHLLSIPLLILTAGCAASPNREAVVTHSGVVVQPGQTFHDCADCPELVIVPAGDFEMGAPSGEPGRYEEEGPQRRVHIKQLAVGKFHVTRGQWAAFVT